MKIQSINEAVEILQKYVPNVGVYSGDNMTLDRLWPLLESIGNPQERLRVIHVAGTSGKTSTAYYIASILDISNKKVGLTVSPHVDSITERIQINGKPISNEKFCYDLGDFLELIINTKPTPSYFELLIAFAYWVFDREKVDYAVIETGMGGLHDGTNVAVRQDKVCVITDIGFDHMHILGNTLTEIAEQKSGIVQDNNAVFTYQQSGEIMQQIRSRANKKHAIIHIIKNIDSTEIATKLQLLPKFQLRNYDLASEVCQYVSERDGFTLSDEYNPVYTIVPARMEKFELEDGSVLIMDGAHNQQKMAVFVDSYIAIYGNSKVPVMLALKEGKEYKAVIDALSKIAKIFIITTFDSSQDLPAKSQNPDVIAKYCESIGVKTLVSVDYVKAKDILLTQKSNTKIITGSFYLLGQVRKSLAEVL